MKIEQELTRMGIELPELDPAYDVKTYGMIVPHFNVENVLTLTAVPEIDARVIHPGRAGDAVSTEQGYEAASTHLLAGLELALDDLDRVKRLLQTVNCKTCAIFLCDAAALSTPPAATG